MVTQHQLSAICRAFQKYDSYNLLMMVMAHAYRTIGNNITGDLLMEMDQNHLKEIGIKKIGDRVRIGSQVKLFRSREFRRSSKKAINRVCNADVVLQALTLLTFKRTL